MEHEWDDEPNELEWIDEETGYQCVMKRGPMGHWCGYVGIPAWHTWMKIDKDDFDASVHGGLTYQNEIPGYDGYFLGFDCAHYDDIIPDFVNRGLPIDKESTYKNVEFVKHEIKLLARHMQESHDATMKATDY